MFIAAHKDHRGAWQISAIVDNQLAQKQYFGYTKKEAIQEFKQEHKVKEGTKCNV